MWIKKVRSPRGGGARAHSFRSILKPIRKPNSVAHPGPNFRITRKIRVSDPPVMLLPHPPYLSSFSFNAHHAPVLPYLFWYVQLSGFRVLGFYQSLSFNALWGRIPIKKIGSAVWHSKQQRGSGGKIWMRQSPPSDLRRGFPPTNLGSPTNHLLTPGFDSVGSAVRLVGNPRRWWYRFFVFSFFLLPCCVCDLKRVSEGFNVFFPFVWSEIWIDLETVQCHVASS